MAAIAKHREAIVSAARSLFRSQGYAATGLAQITARSGAPKGSVYHYFPGGKAEIAEAAVTAAGRVVTATLDGLRRSNPSAAGCILDYSRRLEGWVRASDWRDGCPIATTLLELAPGDAAVCAAGSDSFEAWIAVLSAALIAEGVAADPARRLAMLAVAAIEGALILARVRRDGAPILECGEELAAVFAAAVRRGG